MWRQACPAGLSLMNRRVEMDAARAAVVGMGDSVVPCSIGPEAAVRGHGAFIARGIRQRLGTMSEHWDNQAKQQSHTQAKSDEDCSCAPHHDLLLSLPRHRNPGLAKARKHPTTGMS